MVDTRLLAVTAIALFIAGLYAMALLTDNAMLAAVLRGVYTDDDGTTRLRLFEPSGLSPQILVGLVGLAVAGYALYTTHIA